MDKVEQTLTIQVELIRIGTYVEYQGKSYQILSSTTYQEETGEGVEIGTMYRLCPVSDEGDDCSMVGNPLISVLYDGSNITTI